MATASDYLEQKLRDHIFRGTAYTPPATYYIGLHTANPTDAGGGAEVSGGSYARYSIAAGTGNFANDGTGLTSNVSPITFVTATANWGVLTHFSIWDAASGGNLIVHGALSSSVTINTGQAYTFNANDLDISFAGMGSDYLANTVRDWMFRGGSFAAPSTLYIALHTAATNNAGGGTEVTGGSYARYSMTCSTANWSAPSTTSGLTDNVNAIAFVQATASWGTVTHISIRDASSGGNLITQFALSSGVAVASGNGFTIAAGALDLTFA